MLAKSSLELVERCFEETQGLFEKENLKQAFIDYVFGSYQEEVASVYGLEMFYRHLEQINLVSCRRDFDQAVEEWFAAQDEGLQDEAGYHNILFSLVKETLIQYRSPDKEQLKKDVTYYLTSPHGFMRKWRDGNKRSTLMYFQYLHKLGIRVHQDIESLVEAWLMEHPFAFDEQKRKYFERPNRRGRPNNLELSALLENVQMVKPELTRKEKERIRKIFYYHRRTLSIPGMVEKFRNYLRVRNRLPEDDLQTNPDQC